jgi:hypothetical protein
MTWRVYSITNVKNGIVRHTASRKASRTPHGYTKGSSDTKWIENKRIASIHQLMRTVSLKSYLNERLTHKR